MPTGKQKGGPVTTLRAKRIRDDQRKTLKDCAEAIGVSVSQMSRFETGLRELKSRQLILLADYLGVPPAELLQSEEAVSVG